MIKKILITLRGMIVMASYSLVAIIMAIFISLIGILRLIIPNRHWQCWLDFVMQNILVRIWTLLNILIMTLTTKTKFIVEGIGELKKDGKYFLICNHQTWVDIWVLQRAISLKIPLLIFFMKRTLLWSLPFVGFACWFVGYPFMYRPTKEYLRKHPDRRDIDLKVTQKFCQRFENHPLTIVSYIESTRFSEEKRQQQHSPYQNLLKPKAGTLALTLNTLEELLQNIINVTIIYTRSISSNSKEHVKAASSVHSNVNGQRTEFATPPSLEISFWDLACGKIKEVMVHYEIIPITNIPHGDYLQDRNFRVYFQSWLNQLWLEKDRLISQEKEKRLL